MNKSNIKTRIVNQTTILLALLLYLTSTIYIFDPSLSKPIENFINGASIPWVLYITAIFIYGLIATGWNNVRVIRTYLILNTLSVLIYFYIGVSHASSFPVRVLCFAASTICYFVYFHYRHLFIFIYTRWLIKSKCIQKKKKGREIMALAKSTSLEVFLYFFTLLIFITDLLMTLYLSIYQAFYYVTGSITQHIIDNEHLDIFLYYDYFQYYGSIVAVVAFLFLIILEIKSPDHSGKSTVKLPKMLIKALKSYKLNWLRKVT